MKQTFFHASKIYFLILFYFYSIFFNFLQIYAFFSVELQISYDSNFLLHVQLWSIMINGVMQLNNLSLFVTMFGKSVGWKSVIVCTLYENLCRCET